MTSRQDAVKQRRAIQEAARLNLDAAPNQAGDWKSEDAEYQAEFLAVSHLLADMDGLENDPELLSLKDKPAPIPVIEKVARLGPKLAVAASLVLAAVLGLLMSGQQSIEPNAGMDRYVTRVGEQKEVQLKDGSVVTLNTGSELLVELSEDDRKLILRRGEAYFEVVHDSNKPFTVDAGLRSVTVLGTKFNIRKAPNKLQVAVSEGMVSVHSQQETLLHDAPLVSDSAIGSGERITRPVGQYRLSAGWVMEVAAGKDQLVAHAPKNIQNLTLWRTGSLDFDSVPLVDVVRELNRYSGKKILIEDASIVDLKVLGVIQIDRIGLALQGLEHALPIKVTHHFDQIVLTGAE